MPGLLFHVGAVATCPHAIPIQVIPSNVRVLVNGMPAATLGDQFVVTGCPFTVPPGKPQPCVRVQWLAPATRILINGQPAILNLSSAMCLSADQIPNGPPIVISTQPRVGGM
jgi:uncharacterized Zn-binding protein involved in type VI secretion